MAIKKLIEVALPLERINEESEREKHITQGHPATFHLWWARRPLVTARAIIWSSLVDDPSSHPEIFPTEEAQINERKRLFRILEQLVVWENSNNYKVLEAAKNEILKYNNGIMPKLLDPFAGGGTIPIEGQRLGLESYAYDLNPVAVTINKAMLEIPSVFRDRPSINPVSRALIGGTERNYGSEGIKNDVAYYAKLLKKAANEKVGSLYPEYFDKRTDKSYVVNTWIWTRTVKCKNPACLCEIPLVRSFILSKKKQTIWAEPIYDTSGEVNFKLHTNGVPKIKGTVGRKGVICPKCGSPLSLDEVREIGRKNQMGSKMLAMIVNGPNGRMYVEPTEDQVLAANIQKPDNYPDGAIAYFPGCLNTNRYGLDEFHKLFTNRQLTSMICFTSLISDIKKVAYEDASRVFSKDSQVKLSDGGSGALAYSEAIAVYLAFIVDKLLDYNSSVCTWHVNNQQIAHTFGRQALPMTWDYAEANPFCTSSGSFDSMLSSFLKCFDNFPKYNVVSGKAEQMNAQEDNGLRNVLVSTDPPYYNNIDYSDISDYFYVWLRKSLKDIYPNLYSTLLTPKADELIAMPFRFEENVEKAKKYFEDGMLRTCKHIYLYSSDDYPVSIYYAYKQNDIEDETEDATMVVSSGWETMLTAIIEAGFSINGTWPVRTEKSGRLRANGSNALASSIVLVCRKRPKDAITVTRRNFINELKRELRPALKKLQSSNIAPVDLAQSAIGPGMGVFSKYSKVLEADGSIMTVRSALKVINQELDLYLNEQDSDLDSESRFCVDLYSQFAFNEMSFGDANTLATAKNTSVAIMASHGTLYAQKGKVHLIERSDLPEAINEHENSIWLLCQQLTYRMEKEGVEGCAKAIFNMFGSNAERAKDLAYRLYTIAERKHWAQEAYAYNALVVAWPEIQSRAAELKAVQPEQLSLMDFLQ